MSLEVAFFSSMEWITGGHPLERKKISPSGQAVLLEFSPGFEDLNWCHNGHIAYVLSGTLRLECVDKEIDVHAGDAFLLTQGVAHRASNPFLKPVTLFITVSSYSFAKEKSAQ